MLNAKQGKCLTGQAVITTAGNLPAKYVIHTVGSVWQDGSHNEAELLANCYHNSLKLAVAHHAQSIAFPNISTGIYRFPKELACEIAINAVTDFMNSHDMGELDEIRFVCFDNENFELYQNKLER